MQVDDPDATYPILGALYHPPGGIIRHDAVVWGLARGADAAAPRSTRTPRSPGSTRSNGRVTAVRTNRGTISAGQVLNCTAGWSTLICDMAGVPLPITTHILQACVTEPMKPLLDVVIVSSQMHVYISPDRPRRVPHGRRDRAVDDLPDAGHAELPAGGHAATRSSCSRSSSARGCCAAGPGLCDLSPDYSPILGKTEVENFHVSAGWGTYGFKAAPIVGKTLAELVDDRAARPT